MFKNKKIVTNDNFSRRFSYILDKCLSVQNVARPSRISVRDTIVRYREEMRISEASGLPISSIMGNIIPRG